MMILDNNLTLASKNKEITEFFTRFKYFGPIIVKQILMMY